MRHVQARVGDESREAVLAVLDEESIDYVRSSTQDESVDDEIVEFPVPTEAVEYVLDELRNAGLEGEYIVVSRAETAETANFAELEERFLDENEDDESIAPQEIRSKALDLTPNTFTYYAMTLLSAVVATAGLLLDSPAVVVGSMVIAPQIGSALTASVGLVLNDTKMAIDGMRSQVLGLVMAIAGAALFGLALRLAGFVPPTLDVTTVNQISQRISPGLLTLAVGVAAGAAGAFGLATALPVSLVGVMVAAAIIPAAAAVGIGLAWWLPVVALGAFVLLVVNTVSINLAATFVLRHFGYADVSDAPTEEQDFLQRWGTTIIAVVLVLIAVLSGAVLAGQMAFENAANGAVEDVLSQSEYEDINLVSVKTQFVDLGLFDQTETVTVRVNQPIDQRLPDLATRIGERLSQRFGRPIDVVIEVTQQQRYDPTG